MSAVMFTTAGQRPDFYTGRKWYAVSTICRHEKRVAAYLKLLEIEHYLPLYRANRRWSDGSRPVLDLPIFPSYVFVRMDLAMRGRVLAIPGIVSIVNGVGNKPAHIPDQEIETLLSGLSAYRAEPHPLLVAGQRARIRSGPLSGHEGVLRRIGNNCKVVLTLDLIMRSVAVELSADDLEVLAIA